MMRSLLHPQVPEGTDKNDPGYRAKVGRLSGIVGMIANAVLAVLKLLVGTLSGSLSIAADAMNNFSDATSSLVTLLGFRLAELPADKNHPFGHARFEYLSGLTVALFIILIGFEILKGSVVKTIHPEDTEFTWAVAVVLIGSMLVKLWLSRYNRGLGELIGSKTLEAAAQDSRNDVFSTGAVLIAAVAEHFTGFHIDGPMGLIVSAFIIKSGIEMGMETISPLLGEATNPELQKDIEKLVLSCPIVLGCHDLMVHDYGPGQRFASLHVEMDSSRDPLACHEAIDDLERKCFEELKVHLVIHYDPVVVGDPETDAMKAEVEAVLTGIDGRLSLHDFRMVKGEGHTNLIFDVPLPNDMKGQENEIRAKLEILLSERHHTHIFAVITFDQEGFN